MRYTPARGVEVLDGPAHAGFEYDTGHARVLERAPLLASKRERQAGNHEGQQEDRQDALSRGAETGDLAVGHVERRGAAGISAASELQRVAPGFERDFDGLVKIDAPGDLAVDQRLVCAAADLRPDGVVCDSLKSAAMRDLLPYA
jgi:hypothetical protein